MRESVRDAVKRLGDGWWRSQRLKNGYYWVNTQEERRIQRPDMVDHMIMRQKRRA